MSDPKVRWISFLSLSIESNPSHAPRIHLDSLIEPLVNMVKELRAIKAIRKGEASIRVAEIDITEKYIVLLLQHANKNAADPAFLAFDNHALRHVNKNDNEGVAFSAHVLISRSSCSSGYHDFLLESVQGLSRGVIESFLQFLFRAIVTNQGLEFFNRETRKSKRYYPKTSLLVSPKKNLEDDLVDSVLDEVELVKRVSTEGSEFDEEGYFKEVSTTVKIEVVKKRGILGHMENLMKKANQSGYGKLKIRYKKSGERVRNYEMDTNEESIRNALLARTERIELSENLAQCSDAINIDVVEKMAKML